MKEKKDYSGVYIAYTDSGYHIGRNEGAYSYVLILDGEIVSRDAVLFSHETNNRGELMAIIAAISRCPEDAQVEIRTDSQYAVNTLTGVWLQRRNRDLFQQWHSIVRSRRLKVSVVWIKAHNGDPYNEMCDQMCCDASARI